MREKKRLMYLMYLRFNFPGFDKKQNELVVKTNKCLICSSKPSGNCIFCDKHKRIFQELGGVDACLAFRN